MKPHRVQLSRAAGWKMPANTVKVDRSTRWGNPLAITPDLTREQALAGFSDLSRGWDLTPLKGKNLACWCAPDQPCHADILLERANTEPPFVYLDGDSRFP